MSEVTVGIMPLFGAITGLSGVGNEALGLQLTDCLAVNGSAVGFGKLETDVCDVWIDAADFVRSGFVFMLLLPDEVGITDTGAMGFMFDTSELGGNTAEALEVTDWMLVEAGEVISWLPGTVSEDEPVDSVPAVSTTLFNNDPSSLAAAARVDAA